MQHFNATSSTGVPGHLKCKGCVEEYLHVAVLTGLAPGVRYLYQVDGSPDRFAFTAKNDSATWAPTFGVVRLLPPPHSWLLPPSIPQPSSNPVPTHMIRCFYPNTRVRLECSVPHAFAHSTPAARSRPW